MVKGTRKPPAAPLQIGEHAIPPFDTQPVEALLEKGFVVHCPSCASASQAPHWFSKRAQKCGKIGLLLVGEPDVETLIIELHYIRQRGSGAVVEVRCARRQPA